MEYQVACIFPTMDAATRFAEALTDWLSQDVTLFREVVIALGLNDYADEHNFWWSTGTQANLPRHALFDDASPFVEPVPDFKGNYLRDKIDLNDD